MQAAHALAPAPRAVEYRRLGVARALARIAVYLAELRRAGDAAQRYAELRADGARANDVGRRIFDEVYR